MLISELLYPEKKRDPKRVFITVNYVNKDRIQMLRALDAIEDAYRKLNTKISDTNRITINKVMEDNIRLNKEIQEQQQMVRDAKDIIKSIEEQL